MRMLLAVAILCCAVPVYAQDSQKVDRLTTDALQNMHLDDLKWVDAPALKKGAKISVIAGDPSTAGFFMLYLKMPANYIINPHTHPFAEVITVVKGRLANGIGEKFDREKVDLLDTGSSFILPANLPHYLWNDEETIVLLTATGPFGVKYVNPEDDPRNN